MITIINQPEHYTPSNNPVIFQAQSNNPDIIYFKAVLKDSASAAIINQLNIFPTPALTNGSYINLSRMLSNTVKPEVNNTTDFITEITDSYRAYELSLTENILSGTTIVTADTYTSGVNYIWNADLSRNEFTDYHQEDYLVSTASTSPSFLTLKPLVSSINVLSSEQLYVLTDGTIDLSARMRFYSKAGALLETYQEPITGTSKMFRLDISPRVLRTFISSNFSNIGFYTVDVMDGNTGVSVIKERTYVMKEAPCYQEQVNVIWSNSRGGLDSYGFIAPQETINYVPFKLNNGIFEVDSNGIYSDKEGSIFNPSETVLNNSATPTVKLNTLPLIDAEAYWLQELYQSKQVYVQDASGGLIPAVLQNNSYQIPRLRYKAGELNTFSVDLQLTKGYIPKIGDLITTPESTGNTYTNVEIFSAVTRDNCTGATFPTTVVYTISAGTYYSQISQADADNMALNDLLTNGQAYANSHGVCQIPAFVNSGFTAYFKRGHCFGGYVGSPVQFGVSASTFGSMISQAHADARAYQYLYENGPAYAAIHSTCVTATTIQNNVQVYLQVADNGAGMDDIYYLAKAWLPVSSSISINFQYSLDGVTWSSTINTNILTGAGVGNQQYLTTTTSGNGQFATTKIVGITASSITDQFYTYSGMSAARPVYYTTPRTVKWNKNDCPLGTTATVTRNYSSGYTSSFVSVLDAEAYMSARISESFQAYANANGTCA